MKTTFWNIIQSALGIVILVIILADDNPKQEYVYVPAAMTSSESPATSSPVVVVSPPDEKALREIIRTVLQQEIVEILNKTSSHNAHTTDKNSVQPNSASNVSAFSESNTVVETAIANGEWRNKDTAAMLANSQKLTPEQREELAQRVAGAINRQEMKVVEDIPVF